LSFAIAAGPGHYSAADRRIVFRGVARVFKIALLRFQSARALERGKERQGERERERERERESSLKRAMGVILEAARERGELRAQ